MAARIVPVEVFDIVVFGATGDLVARKLLPALFYRCAAGQLPSEARIFGCARRTLTRKAFQALAREAITAHVPKADRDEKAVAHFIERLDYVAAQATEDTGWSDLVKALKDQPDRIRVFYLATTPELFAPICERISRFGLATPHARVVVEKPIGHSLASAREVNDAIGRAFSEDRIYRIDHYLGKETVQNLMALRFANALFEPLWNAGHINHVQITVAETLGVEGRAGYYDTAGALRDMMQNHMMQLLCLTAMEPPTSFTAEALRAEKLKVLKTLVPINAATSSERTVRGQYRAGASSDGPVPGYLEELGNDSSHTETFVALHAEIANWRWAGVPFFLRTGKRLPSRVSEIVVAFRPIPHSVFDGTAGPITPNHTGDPVAAG